jgi:hypothetical protein
MELLTVFSAKNNAMLVNRHQIFVYLVTEQIGFHGQQKIMIVYAFMVILIIIRLIAIYAKSNALLALHLLLIAYPVKEQTELLGVQ